MKGYTPNQDALKIAQIRYQTGLNYSECRKLAEKIDIEPIRCTKCNQSITPVRPSLENGWVSWQHINHKWDASHEAEPQENVK
jgi:hypothetical protein